MRTLIVTSEAGYDHRIPPAHAEQPQRLRAVMDALAEAPLDRLKRAEARAASRGDLTRVHTEDHVDRVAACEPDDDGLTGLDWDTYMTKGSWKAALHAAGSGLTAVDAVMKDEAEAVFCAVRPPGHHAERARPMGFCLFNNVAVAAMYALEAHGLDRVAIVDIDVHHGNGSQELAERESRVFFASIHQAPLYPGTGRAEETGLNGNVVNVPVPAGTTGEEWRAAIERDILPALESFDPELLFISAGFDAHAADPLAGLTLDERDYAWAGRKFAEFRGKSGVARLVCLLEGGYDLGALGRSAAVFTQALAEA